MDVYLLYLPVWSYLCLNFKLEANQNSRIFDIMISYDF